MRVFVLNNYPLDQVWEEVKRGDKPDHHLYGINYFYERGYEVHIVPFAGMRFLQEAGHLCRYIPVALGDLPQQSWLLARLAEVDLIYSPCQTQTDWLAYLRSAGLIKVPIVCLAHHPPNKGRLSWLRKPFLKVMIAGIDSFPALSVRVADMINELSGKSGKSQPLSWGPDADYYSVKSTGVGIVAAGRTGRDFETFGRGATMTKSQVSIICLESATRESFGQFGPNVKVSVSPDNSPMTYRPLIDIYAQARALAIPLIPGEHLGGLTGLLDALALGKPVIMTRTPFIDIDIEALGIGRWVEPGDAEGWREAIEFFEKNEKESSLMGRRARALVEKGMNSRAFANQVMDLFDAVCGVQTKN